ncbi:DUF6263 family protein [Chitinophaga pinensis]|uniref:Uncharacterized protein n=1 Tax=Chitinophaga pinensis (strain ATCC 43595 / DSM 2588 / LMG 13176 / NBRC 15968 / NCIMB 11800 / UQM 2034) TaxID=485918 RepID=A0A979GSY7_CHIPD|nr:DUF6263 family protein [Chitinophaga pinensis]ACU63412.1 hypothetical protein Cpin_5998 [Chitinophaga pinensis DSM 2588]
MNHYRLLLLLLLGNITQLVSAQNKVLLKISMDPGKTYKTQMTTIMDMEMTVKGDSAIINQLNASGMQLPIVMHMKQQFANTTKTGQQRADKKTPLTMTFDQMSMSQSVSGQETVQNENPFADAVIEGTTNGDGKISIDTIKGELDDALKMSLRQMVNNLQQSIKFPTEELKIGDSFDMEVPMNLPIPQAEMKMMLVTKYTLKEIKDRKAIFDLKQNITMDMSMVQNDNKGNGAGTGAGTGNGTMIFDINKKIAEQSDSNIQFQFEFDVSGLTMSATCNGKTTVKCTVE